MAAPQKELFESVLDKYGRKDAVHRAVIGGWEDYKASSEYEKWKRKGTRASIVWERMVDRALDDLYDQEGVQVLEKDDTVSLIFDEKLFLRFKKGSNKKLSSNYPTQLALSYHKHDRDLFGFEGVQRGEIIYVLNNRETEVEGVYVVAREGEKVIWDFEITGSIDNIQALPITPQHPAPSKRLVRLKGAKEKDAGKKASNDGAE